MTWTIDDIPVSFVGDSTPPTLTRGSEITLPCVLVADADAETVAPRDSRYSFQYSVNYEGPEAKEPFREHYNRLLDFIRYSGDEVVRRGTTDRGVPWFRERLPDAAPVETLVVAIDVPEDYPERRSHWGIIIGGQDNSVGSADYRRVDLDVFVLADRDEFDDRSDVVAAFGDEIAV